LKCKKLIFTGKLIEEKSGNITNTKSCYFTIKNLKELNMGSWTCRIFHSLSSQFQEAIIAATSDGKISRMRLPKQIFPQHYKIFLTPFIIQDNFTFEGHIEIDMKIMENNVSKIILHSQDLNVYENTVKVVNSETNQAFEVIGFGFENATQFLTIHFSKNLPMDSTIKLSLAYLGNLGENLVGFYRSSYFEEENNSTVFMATSKFSAIAARRALPCFDEPAFKAIFQINLGRLKNMTSISNMPKEREGISMADNDEYVWDVYQETPKMSSYLLAFIVTSFTFRKSKALGDGVDFKIWSRKSVLDQTELASEIAPKILEFYEDRFKTKFPLPKQDMIAIPDFMTGAMENWGLITYREVFLLNKPGKSSAADREWTEIVIAHELSHQWFGNLVTMEWWTE